MSQILNVDKESYAHKPARLRMQWMARPKTNKATFELISLGIAVIAGCESCIKAHEASVLQHGLSEEHVHDAARIAAVIEGFAVALNVAGWWSTPPQAEVDPSVSL